MSQGTKKDILLNEQDMSRSLRNLAQRIADRHKDRRIALVGLLSRGNVIARRLGQYLIEAGLEPEFGHLDISLYRDDLGRGTNPALRSSDLPFSVDDADIILVDDVLYTGRTIRAALNAVMDYGRPARVELAVLVDRGGREMPIQPDYVGLDLRPASESLRLDGINIPDEAKVVVRLREEDGEDLVFLA